MSFATFSKGRRNEVLKRYRFAALSNALPIDAKVDKQPLDIPGRPPPFIGMLFAMCLAFRMISACHIAVCRGCAVCGLSLDPAAEALRTGHPVISSVEKTHENQNT